MFSGGNVMYDLLIAVVINMFRLPELLTSAIVEAIEIEIGIAIGTLF